MVRLWCRKSGFNSWRFGFCALLTTPLSELSPALGRYFNVLRVGAGSLVVDRCKAVKGAGDDGDGNNPRVA